MKKEIQLEIYIDGVWKDLGLIELQEKDIQQGYRAPGRFEYQIEYTNEYINQLETRGLHAVSVRYPLNYSSSSEKNWPAFLLDLLPTGAARLSWLKKLGLVDGSNADFLLLSKGAINPPGNVRVKPEPGVFKSTIHQGGFEYSEVIGRSVDFIDYAEKMGAIVSGTSGAQGAAPKFLLVKDTNEKWHGDGAIPENQIAEHYLVKFPRGKKETDYEILRSEKLYYEVAAEIGVKTKGPLTWDSDALFIPRFDRVKELDGSLMRLGLESLISCMGVSEFGARKNIEDYIQVLSTYSTQPQEDIKEFIFRDFLNIVMGNTDNHGRNSALLKTKNSIEISPLFDFAPMVLDDSGIPRAARWKQEEYHIPGFSYILTVLQNFEINIDESKEFLKESLERMRNINALLTKKGMLPKLQKLATKKYDDFMNDLEVFVRRQ